MSGWWESLGDKNMYVFMEKVVLVWKRHTRFQVSKLRSRYYLKIRLKGENCERNVIVKQKMMRIFFLLLQMADIITR